MYVYVYFYKHVIMSSENKVNFIYFQSLFFLFPFISLLY